MEGEPAPDAAPTRNLLGFKDGTSNPDPTNEQQLDQYVWIDDNSGEPAWAANGSNPRTGQARILRRGFSYANGADPSGLLDQGLLFVAYQKSLAEGFVAAQRRLDGEPLEDYIKPVGGGFFFVLPGPGRGPDGWLGQSLLET